VIEYTGVHQSVSAGLYQCVSTGVHHSVNAGVYQCVSTGVHK